MQYGRARTLETQMGVLSKIGISVVAIGLTGCTMLQTLEEKNTFMVSALEINSNVILCKPAEAKDTTAANAGTVPMPTLTTKECIGAIINDSEEKCANFLNGLVLAENSVNTGFDMATTLFTALATAFTPLATVHALTAAGTISSGWRTAINSNIYAKATIGNYAQ